MTDRAHVILRDIDVDTMVGLEIGPLANPLIARAPGRSIFYADYAPQSELREKSKGDPNVNIDNIPHIDFIISPMPEMLGMAFDYIVASHVGEHVPDFIGWIKALCRWLKPNGKIVLALPDSRFTFDCKRPMSTSGQMIEAYLEKRQRPPLSSIYDGFSKSVRADGWHLWEAVEPPAPFENYYTRENSLNLTKQAHETGIYRDCHCWVFSAQHFKSLIEELSAVGVIDFKITRFDAPEKYNCEFYVEIAAN